MRILILLARSAPPAEALAASRSVRERHLGVEVVLSDKEWAAVGLQQGGWEGWVRYVAKGVNPITGSPCFDGYVVPWRGPHGPGRIGRITAQILSENAGTKPVWTLVDGDLRVVEGTQVVDDKDWKGGWRLVVPGLD